MALFRMGFATAICVCCHNKKKINIYRFLPYIDWQTIHFHEIHIFNETFSSCCFLFSVFPPSCFLSHARALLYCQCHIHLTCYTYESIYQIKNVLTSCLICIYKRICISNYLYLLLPCKDTNCYIVNKIIHWYYLLMVFLYIEMCVCAEVAWGRKIQFPPFLKNASVCKIINVIYV